ncbi:MAG: hypothetical protein EXX96DRAFT_552774 [Benjaminiella poitrasii]|nr:MAG: hypothetical protein EXX96DRAFT_552774 [Benjaminiella poitrasii]
MEPSLCNSSSSDSSISSHNSGLEKKEPQSIDYFRFNVTEPSYIKQRQIKTPLVIVTKLVDQMKKLGHQVYNRPSFEDCDILDSFISSEIDILSSSVEQTGSWAFNNAEDIQQTSTTAKHGEEIINCSYQGERENITIFNRYKSRANQQKKICKSYFKRKKSINKFKNVLDLINSHASFPTTGKRRLAGFAKHKKRRFKSELSQYHLKRNPNFKKDDIYDPIALLKIRQQMLGFKIPADWTHINFETSIDTTIVSNTRSCLTRDIMYDLIDNMMKKKKDIGILTERVKESKELILKYNIELDKLENDIREFKFFREEESWELETFMAPVDCNIPLLKSEYKKYQNWIHKINKITEKYPVTHLSHLQIKVQHLHKLVCIWAQLRFWSYPLAAVLGLLIMMYLL